MIDKEKYFCANCNSELNVSYIRLQKMIHSSFELKMKNKRLLDFVKSIANHFNFEIEEKAIRLLKEIGETE